MTRRSHRLIWLSLLSLAVLRGGLYATSLPPWGLIDEEHHFHYIQHLAEQRTIPVVGETYLSPEIVESLFATRRWEVFHWPTPASPDPREMGLEGYSYEGYQPPLFYLLLVPLYGVLPDDLLTKLYCLRWVVIGLSLLTVWMTYRIATEVFPQHHALPYLTCVLLVLIPERTAAVSRINNDVLLEVIAAAFIWVCTRAVLRGLSIRHSQLLGLLLGLGVWTKMSMAVLAITLPFVFWTNRHTTNLRAPALWTGGISVAMVVPLVARNLQLYGDVTGFASFRALNEAFGAIPPVRFTWEGLAPALWELFCHVWVVWWKGAEAGTNALLTGLCALLALLSGLSLVTVAGHLRGKLRDGSWGRFEQVIVMYLCAIGGYALAVLISYFDGRVPVIQGRFLLPVVVPLVLLFAWGLGGKSRNKAPLLVSLGPLIALDALSLFGNLLPYYYYWSAFVKDGKPQPHAGLGWPEAWNLFLARFLSDKPPGTRAVLIGVLTLYVASLVLTSVMIGKTNPPSDLHLGVLNDLRRG